MSDFYFVGKGTSGAVLRIKAFSAEAPAIAEARDWCNEDAGHSGLVLEVAKVRKFVTRSIITEVAP